MIFLSKVLMDEEGYRDCISRTIIILKDSQSHIEPFDTLKKDAKHYVDETVEALFSEGFSNDLKAQLLLLLEAFHLKEFISTSNFNAVLHYFIKIYGAENQNLKTHAEKIKATLG